MKKLLGIMFWVNQDQEVVLDLAWFSLSFFKSFINFLNKYSGMNPSMISSGKFITFFI